MLQLQESKHESLDYHVISRWTMSHQSKMMNRNILYQYSIDVVPDDSIRLQIVHDDSIGSRIISSAHPRLQCSYCSRDGWKQIGYYDYEIKSWSLKVPNHGPLLHRFQSLCWASISDVCYLSKWLDLHPSDRVDLDLLAWAWLVTRYY